MYTLPKEEERKERSLCYKIEYGKAYDRMEWDYLRGIMLKLGFDGGFVERAMRCVSSVSFSVKVNGKLSEILKPTRGIIYGDLISPYRFLLCAEGSSSLS
jgi:hypothetical protein